MTLSILKAYGTYKIPFISDIFSDEKRDQQKLWLTTDKQYNKQGQSFFQGPLRKQIKHNRIQISELQYKELIKNQQILSVKRCAQSLTGLFPSGLLTLVTYPLSGMAVRHEYIIIETPDIMMRVEITKKDEGVIKVNMFNFKTKREKKLVEGIIDEGRWYSRTMMEENDCKNLNLVQMDQFMNLILQIWRNFGNGSYDFTQKNCCITVSLQSSLVQW